MTTSELKAIKGYLEVLQLAIEKYKLKADDQLLDQLINKVEQEINSE